MKREKLGLPVLPARWAQSDHKALAGRKASLVRRGPSALRGLQECLGRRARQVFKVLRGRAARKAWQVFKVRPDRKEWRAKKVMPDHWAYRAPLATKVKLDHLVRKGPWGRVATPARRDRAA